MNGVYYNEIDPYPAQWLRNLIAAGHLPEGDVDERSIVDVRPDDLRGYRQCHFFAGIGGWPLALRWAGAEDIEDVWTGSCPCQPLSVAGQQKGHADERHLWPAFYGLIAECKPAIVFGEQVASKDGREWLAGVRADLESVGYACGAADLPACSVGAPHRRNRLWFVADTFGQRTQGPCTSQNFSNVGTQGERRWGTFGAADLRQLYDAPLQRGSSWPQPILRVLDDGISAKVGKLRAYGNAIVPQVAAEFIRAAL